MNKLYMCTNNKYRHVNVYTIKRIFDNGDILASNVYDTFFLFNVSDDDILMME